MNALSASRPYRGVFPVAPTIFFEDGRPDLEGQKRAIDFMIDAGSTGICILANFSEQFVLSDAERDEQMRLVLEHVAGRVPVIVTTSHFSTDLCVERSKAAEAMGAAMIMVMPPYHGATFRVGEGQIMAFFRALSDAVSIPIMIQDAPVAGTPLPPALLAKIAKEVENVSYFKVETAGAASKIRELIAIGGTAIEGPWDGEEAITLMADLDAGATGSMTGGGFPDGIREILDPFFAGDRAGAMAAYAKWLPLINYENRQTSFQTAKILMKEGGIIGSEAVRRPILSAHPDTRAGLIEIARSLDPLVLRWGK
ncbi:4-hydroxy-tetrahydrodipicolinate synthase [Fulvimarina manganoxydans]|uniref:4-hydroxy-tetrahydrodipicolinate synthase n=1 Tax=Fulvimarina manganoxydans TaxID=937218 RepID=A0A1W2EWQ0_9HYPH|nr:dihydrodipicolinate synthase family protein [Fulvimarina manganoxydans]SMD13656.1 4-hydroxy-tetrahydrodipicolinate synthase [Fulvimarina manganoxydans]